LNDRRGFAGAIGQIATGDPITEIAVIRTIHIRFTFTNGALTLTGNTEILSITRQSIITYFPFNNAVEAPPIWDTAIVGTWISIITIQIGCSRAGPSLTLVRCGADIAVIARILI